MSCYDHKINFIERTLAILKSYEKHSEYEKTLFLNCCIGLLIMPQQCAVKDPSIIINEDVDKKQWGIDIEKIKVNVHAKGSSATSVENIAYHFRNSMCHYRFDVISCNKDNIENIIISDKFRETDEEYTFYMEIRFNDFRKFVLTYAEVLKAKLQAN